ncbi:MAG TPA: tetratricopeptide repeat protein [archaeon]|nr:tetratricopeptide repeat protein [archaeon]
MLLLGAILLLAGVLRIYGISWGVPGADNPRNFHPDEKMAPLVLSRMRPAEGQFDPYYYINPTLFYYQYGLLLWPVASLTGITPPWKIKSYSAFVDHEPGEQRIWFLTGRVMTVLMGIITVWGVFWLGSLLADQRMGLLAAALFAVLPAHVIQSHYMVGDAPAVMWMVLSLSFFVLGLERKNTWAFAGSGLMLGLGLATKYTSILIALPALVLLVQEAWQWNTARRNNNIQQNKPGQQKKNTKRKKVKPASKSKKMTLGWGDWLMARWPWFLSWGGLAAVGFVIGCPYSILNLDSFLGVAGLGGLRKYNTFGLSLTRVFSTSFFLGLGLPLMLAAMGGIVLFLRRPGKKVFALGVILIANILILILNASPYMRHFVPLTPFLALAAGYLLFELYNGCVFKLGLSARKWIPAVGAVIFLYTAAYSAALVHQMGQEEHRMACASWIREHPRRYQIIAVIKPEWGDDFYSVQIDANTYSRVVIGYKYSLVESYAPDYLVISEYETLDCLGNEEGRNLLGNLERSKILKPVKTFERDISFLGLPFPYNPPGSDWLYFCPNITVYGHVNWPDSSRAFFIKGLEVFSSGRNEEAYELLKRAVELQSSNPLYRMWLARASLACVDAYSDPKDLSRNVQLLDLAQGHTQRGLQLGPRIWMRVELLEVQARIRLKMGYLLDAQGQPGLAEKAITWSRDDLVMQKILADSLSNVELSDWDDNYNKSVLALAYHYKRAGKLGDAEREVNSLLKKDANNVQGLLMLVDIYLQKGDRDQEALRLLERTLEIDPSLRDSKNSNILEIIEKLKIKIKSSQAF